SLALSNNVINLLKISTLLKYTAICKAFIFNIFFLVNINFLTNPFSNFLQLVNKKLTIFKFPSSAAKSNAVYPFWFNILYVHCTKLSINPFAPNSKCSCNGVPINLEMSPLNKDSILIKNCSLTKLSSSSKKSSNKIASVSTQSTPLNTKHSLNACFWPIYNFLYFKYTIFFFK
ncbi:hypothetical protein BLOT_012459, partial [Blomia tropicalis]